ncbi:TrmH family RNA methyltransferase [Candidatus Saccharibacteria bacterium]|nr:TrmH family RNA methyltransferase [Candidatus Saccharibacteria bacterium]
MSQIALILHNIRSCHNVGSILRTADGFGVSKIIFSGYTPRVDDSRALPHLRDKINRQIAKTALGAEQYLNLETSDDIEATLKHLAKESVILGLENNLKDPRKIEVSFANLSHFRSALESTEKQGPKQGIALILGEEVEGIEKDLYKYIDFFLEIPMRGQKESFNVSVATGVALFYLTNL